MDDRGPITVGRSTPASRTRLGSCSRRVRHLPVIDEIGQVVGIASLRRVSGATQAAAEPGLSAAAAGAVSTPGRLVDGDVHPRTATGGGRPADSRRELAWVEPGVAFAKMQSDGSSGRRSSPPHRGSGLGAAVRRLRHHRPGRAPETSTARALLDTSAARAPRSPEAAVRAARREIVASEIARLATTAVIRAYPPPDDRRTAAPGGAPWTRRSRRRGREDGSGVRAMIAMSSQIDQFSM